MKRECSANGAFEMPFYLLKLFLVIPGLATDLANHSSFFSPRPLCLRRQLPPSHPPHSLICHAVLCVHSAVMTSSETDIVMPIINIRALRRRASNEDLSLCDIWAVSSSLIRAVLCHGCTQLFTAPTVRPAPTHLSKLHALTTCEL